MSGSSRTLYDLRRVALSTTNVRASYSPSVASGGGLIDHSSASRAISRRAEIDGVSKRLTTDGIAVSCRTMRSPAARNDLAALGSLIAIHLDICSARVLTDACWGISASGRVGSLVKRWQCLCIVFA